MSTKYVYVDVDENLHELDPSSGEGPILEPCMDRVLIEASESTESGPTQGVVRAVLGVDKHWHFAGHLTRAERKALDLGSPEECRTWRAEMAQKRPADG